MLSCHQAFLRIRPDMGGDGPKKVPYLESLSDTAVRMIDPSRDDPRGYSGIPRFRPSAAPTSSIYTFTHVFPPATQQPEFFGKTTLPLVRGLLDGEDGLLFAYGVTNSGKTYTMQGGSQQSSAGILPRTIDVLFNSIEGLQGSSKVSSTFDMLHHLHRFPFAVQARSIKRHRIKRFIVNFFPRTFVGQLHIAGTAAYPG